MKWNKIQPEEEKERANKLRGVVYALAGLILPSTRPFTCVKYIGNNNKVESYSLGS